MSLSVVHLGVGSSQYYLNLTLFNLKGYAVKHYIKVAIQGFFADLFTVTCYNDVLYSAHILLGMLRVIYVSSCAVDIKAQIEACHALDSVFYAVGFVSACKLCLRNLAVLYSIAYYDLVISVNVIAVVDLTVCAESNFNGSLVYGKCSFVIAFFENVVSLVDIRTIRTDYFPCDIVVIISVVYVCLGSVDGVYHGLRRACKERFKVCILLTVRYGKEACLASLYIYPFAFIIHVSDLVVSVKCVSGIVILGIVKHYFDRSLSNIKSRGCFKSDKLIVIVICKTSAYLISLCNFEAIAFGISKLNVGSCSVK